MFNLQPSTLKQNQELFEAYLNSLSGINDSFWEGLIQQSRIYTLHYEGQTVGLVGKYYEEESLSFFYLAAAYHKQAQVAFKAVLEELQPRNAFVTTTDELFLSLSLDHHIKVEMDAYFFRQGDVAVRPPEFGREMLRLAVPEDEADILDTEDVAENIRLQKYYVLRENGVFLGQGFYERHALKEGVVSIGMATHPEHRQKGVGRSIIMHLANICCEQGFEPVCGCGYYNSNSKRTLESAGFVTRTRMLKVWFCD